MNAKEKVFGATVVSLVFTGLVVASCGTSGTAALQSQPGQLFCAIQTNGGGSILAGVIDAEATAASPAAAPIAILATNATKVFVDNACTQAAANTGAVSAIPASPPANPAAAPTVAVKKSAVVS